ncbi:MAG: restriction endonuclease, partial [Rubrivivax sp.]|nr:restriction endonuclease [Rubrivivax sp.]
MAKGSLFAILLRSPWWASLAIAAVLALLSGALLPEGYRVAGALTAAPFLVISAVAARRQWHLPGAARVAEVHAAVAAMAWPAFAGLLEQAFTRDGHTVRRAGPPDPAFDFELERQGRRMLVCARRWKSARIGLETLRALQAAREAAEAPDALFIGLADFTEQARAFALQHRIAVWQAAELAQALRGMPLGAAA